MHCILTKAMAKKQQVALVVVPFPVQGHLNQLLHFSLNLSSQAHPNRLSVHYACSAPHTRQAKSRIQGWDAGTVASIHFHELPTPSFPVLPPDPNSTTKFPLHALPAWEASMSMEQSIRSLLESLSKDSCRLVVIYDRSMSFAGHAADSFANAESYMFRCTPAFFALSLAWHKELNPIKPRQEVADVIRAPLSDIVPDEIWDFMRRHRIEVASHAGDIINACRGIEGEFIDLLAGEPHLRGKKVFAVGPLCPIAVEGGRVGRHECLEWLGKQPPASVVYVSFGPTSTPSDEQVKQIALGLKLSRQRFIWVLRDADRGDVFADVERCRQRELPRGFEDEVEGLGIVVRGWAPQLEILAHPSTGAFASHCGWNSCLESLSMGVPIITWPMHSDQPRNEIMVTDYWKVGVAVREWAQKDEVVSAAMIQESINKVMVGEAGMEMRKRVRSLSEVLRLSVGEAGTSRAEFNSFVAHVTRP